MKLWTWKLAGALAVMSVFVLDQCWHRPDETTGQIHHLVPFGKGGVESSVASFIFLLVFLFTVSHMGSWVLWKVRHRGAEAEAKPPKKSKKRKRR
ncbi:hypothetical protein ACFL09_03160 [Planctomycetota bacterium]